MTGGVRALDPAPLVAVAAAIGLFIWLVIIEPSALSYSGVSLVLIGSVPLVFAAVGQMIVIALGDIDLGTGYAIGLVNVVVALIMTHNELVGWVLLAAFVVGYGMIGLLVAWRGIPAIIVTLGAGFVWLGISLIVAPTPAGSAPAWLGGLMALNPPGIPMPLGAALLVMVVGGTLVTFSRPGLLLRAVGSHRGAVRDFGGHPRRVRVLAYMVVGVCMVAGGLSLTGITDTGSSSGVSQYTLLAIAAVILGGGQFSGGKAPVVGVVCGAIALSLVASVMSVVSIPSSLQTGVEGVILVAAVLGQRLVVLRRP
ncbi:MAG TPA: ABC transporter permease [Candidatus Acidoferrales bacterium]|nr:ABC transporter permease [Candidatus Acidoferrales bacterium]